MFSRHLVHLVIQWRLRGERIPHRSEISAPRSLGQPVGVRLRWPRTIWKDLVILVWVQSEFCTRRHLEPLGGVHLRWPRMNFWALMMLMRFQRRCRRILNRLGRMLLSRHRSLCLSPCPSLHLQSENGKPSASGSSGRRSWTRIGVKRTLHLQLGLPIGSWSTPRDRTGHRASKRLGTRCTGTKNSVSLKNSLLASFGSTTRPLHMQWVDASWLSWHEGTVFQQLSTIGRALIGCTATAWCARHVNRQPTRCGRRFT